MATLDRRLARLEAAAYRRMLERYAAYAGCTVAELAARADRLSAQIRDVGWDRALEALADEQGIDAGALRAGFARFKQAMREGRPVEIGGRTWRP